MKVEKQFAPITITLETDDDRRDLLDALYTAQWAYGKGTDSNSKNMVEKITLFTKELK